MTHPALNTELCRRTGCAHPVVQTAMAWVSTPELVTATARAGGLGILSAAVLSADELDRAVAGIQDAVGDAPFGVGFLMEQPDVERVVNVLVARGVRVAAYNRAPDPRLIGRLKEGGISCMPTIGAVRHATTAVELGADMLIVQGAEGGGHTGTVPTSLLVPQVVAEVDVPVIAAGGFKDGHGLVAALAYGAVGIAMGTRFMLTTDSPVADAAKRRYLDAGLEDTVVTRNVDGLPQRVLRTPLVERLDRSGDLSLMVRALRNGLAYRRLSGTSPRELLRSAARMRRNARLTRGQVLMAANAPILVREALVAGDPEAGVFPTGQVAGAIDDLPSCARLIDSIVTTAGERLEALAAQEA